MVDKIKKLLLKLSKKDNEKIRELSRKLINGEIKGLDIVKVVNSDFYRLKSGRFRIIYHFEDKVVIIDSIKLRNEKTYK